MRVQHGATGDWTFRALVDTGAPITVFDLGVAEALNLRIRHAGAHLSSVRILGGVWQAQFEDVDLNLTIEPDLSWSARVAFILEQGFQMPFQGVLGTDGFLDKFAVTFNKYYNYFVVERPDDFDDRVGRHLSVDPVRVADESWRRHGAT